MSKGQGYRSIPVLFLLTAAFAACDGESVPPPTPSTGGSDVKTADDASDATTAGDAAGDALTEGKAPADLASLFDMEAILSDDKINIQVKANNVKKLDDPAGVWLVPFAFRSQIWRANAWDHPAVLYLPSDMPSDNVGALVVMQQGTPDLDAGQGVIIDDDYGAATAAELGIPVLLLGQVPYQTTFNPAESKTLAAEYPTCFNRLLQQDELDDCSEKLTISAEDFKWSVTVAMARAYMRAITAVSFLSQKLSQAGVTGLPPIVVNRVMAAGAGTRGRGLWVLGAVDPRVQGIWVAADDMANLPAFFKLQQQTWTSGFHLGDPTVRLELLEGPLGPWWRSVEDPATFADKLATRSVMIVRGTNDPFFPVGATELYLDALPTDTSFLMVDGYGHGVATPKHLTGFRTFASHVLAKRPLLRAEAVYTEIGPWQHSVTVTLDAVGSSAPTLIGVNAWYTVDQTVEDADLRDASWEKVALVHSGADPLGRPRYKGDFVSVLTSWAAYVEVEETHGGQAGLVTTPIHAERSAP